ncbi:kelch domain-containing protein 10-like, partial [Corapipo altera]|uniref:kelch domain-containing protein 10-like n=1 Tax=Corapipo altera TaxID=415028 RepID=UPI000FD66F4D
MECLAKGPMAGPPPPPASQNHPRTGCFSPLHPNQCPSLPVVLHGNNLLVFGGTGIPFGESNGNDVHVCNVKYKRWALLSCRGKKPNRIYGQAMAIINGCLYVFGGTTGYIYSTDLHRLDLNTREWVQLKPNNMSCDMPEERYRHEIAHDGQRIYILGGGTSWTAYSLDKVRQFQQGIPFHCQRSDF